ncbi:RHS repeat domain-containing protein [Tenacibaculum aiptasiae]|uniref:RHS repeat domain-containing protein n=1 Tax=Tenacibaculum aiptasiae TaxID=426481 RepID=UPI003B5A6815
MNKFIVSLVFILVGVFSVKAQIKIEDPDVGGGSTTVCMYRDADGDGYGAGSQICGLTIGTPGYSIKNGDCNDNNAEVKPRTWYRDADGDGFGLDSEFKIECVLSNSLTGWSLVIGDCDDTEADIKPLTWYRDADGDGIGIGSESKVVCALGNVLSGWSLEKGDCNDSNSSVGVIKLYRDQDNDGLGDPNTPHYANNSTFTSVCEAEGYVTNKDDKCPLNAGSSANSGCPVGEGFVIEARNSLYEKSYLINKKVTSESKTYYNDLGKIEQGLSLDIKTKKVWGAHTFYDAEGRLSVQTLSGPAYSNETLVFKSDFVKKPDGTVYKGTDFDGVLPENSPKIGDELNSLGWYYSNSNTSEPFQDKTDRPYSRTIYSSLLSGRVKQVVGGNKHDTNGNGTIDDANDKWERGYSFSMPAAQELYYVFGYNAFESNPSEASTYENISNILGNGNNQIVWLKAGKTVVQDAHGNESVAFTDSEGKILGTARSGGNKEYEVLSLIGKQKYVDIHIPKGTSNNSAQLIGDSSNYKIYDLKTEKIVSVSALKYSGFFRIEYVGETILTPSHALTYIDKIGKTINPVKIDAVGIRYKVNYYDFSLNEYDKAGQLIKSLQPLGFDSTCLNELKPIVTHNESLKSTFVYNTLGLLTYTKSPDEGEAWFKYRKDGKIRFSQNSKQVLAKEFSYTNYDRLGRSVESGVYKEEIGGITFKKVDDLLENFLDDISIDDDGLPNSRCKEQSFTQYDFLTDTQKTALTSGYTNPTFLSGSVAHTYNTDDIGTIISKTYYSYDVHGRVKWIFQISKGLTEAKTIDYVYEPITSQVSKIYFEKNNVEEQFIHRYTYDQDTQQLKTVETSTVDDDNSFTLHASYDYYETGAIKRVTLAEGLQDIDYVYNLAGQLKAINHPDLVKDSEINPEGNDLFGMVLDYHTGDYIRNNKFVVPTAGTVNQYNGNIKAFTWGSKSNSEEDTSTPSQYKYSYDRNNWLTSAIFDGMGGVQAGTPENLYLKFPVLSSQDKLATNSITLEEGFSVTASSSLTFTAKIGGSTSGGVYGIGDYNVSNITYDANGNILSLDRNKNTESGSNKMDELSYTYKNGKSNRLDRVIDNVGNVGVQDIDTQEAGNYVYNNIGQLIENKGEGVKYKYNGSGLVTEVIKNDVSLIKFFYNDKGYRIQKISYKVDGITINKITNYLRDASGNVIAIYDDNTQIELPIYSENRLGIYKKTTNTNVYQLTDHLGNVRTVIAKSGDQAIAMSKTDYYPGGMVMPNRQFVNGEPYRYGYQGEFSETDSETGKQAFQLRLYDPRINRWLSPDPYGQFYSPYLAMGNNGVNFVDPDGGYCYDAQGKKIPCPKGDFFDAYRGASEHTNILDDIHTSKDIKLLSKNDFYKGLGPQFWEGGQAYKFNERDLRVAIDVLNGPDNVIKQQVRKVLSSGVPEPLSGYNLRMWYGDRWAQYKVGSDYVGTAAPLAAGAFGGGKLRTNMSFNSRGHLNPTTRVTVYRAVDNVELANIKATNKLTVQKGGTEAKYFANSLSNAHKFGKFLYPNGYTVISARIGVRTAGAYWSPYTDGMGAYIIPGSQLSNMGGITIIK